MSFYFPSVSHFIFLSTIFLCSLSQALAQPQCEFAASDPDGDYWGYEFGESCQVTGLSYGPFSIFDPISKNQIDFQKLFWQRSDLVGRTMTCVRESTYSGAWCGSSDRPSNLSEVGWFSKNCEGRFYGTTLFKFLENGTFEKTFFYTLGVDQPIQQGPVIDLNATPESITYHNWDIENGLLRAVNERFTTFGTSGAEDFAVIDSNGALIFYGYYGELLGNPPRMFATDREYCTGVSPAGSELSTDDSNQNNSSSECIDTDGDGYGWNGMETCDPLDSDSGGDSSGNSSNNANRDGCDYADADLYNGWGWNPDTQTSCEPLESDNSVDPDCNYRDADLYNGWGWNPFTKESCRPLAES